MKIQNISLRPGLIVTKQSAEERSSASGIIVSENENDFIVHGEVVLSSSDGIPVGSSIIYHVLDCESFRDGAQQFFLVSEEKVKGVYARENE